MGARGQGLLLATVLAGVVLTAGMDDGLGKSDFSGSFKPPPRDGYCRPALYRVNKAIQREMRVARLAGVTVEGERMGPSGPICQFVLIFQDEKHAAVVETSLSDAMTTFKQLEEIISRCLREETESKVPIVFRRLKNVFGVDGAVNNPIRGTAGASELECVLSPVNSQVEGTYEEYGSAWAASAHSREYADKMVYKCDVGSLKYNHEDFVKGTGDKRYASRIESLAGMKHESEEESGVEEINDISELFHDKYGPPLSSRDQEAVDIFLQTGTVLPPQCIVGNDMDYDSDTVYTIPIYIHLLTSPKRAGGFTLKHQEGSHIYLPFVSGPKLKEYITTMMAEVNRYYEPHKIKFEVIGFQTFAPHTAGQLKSQRAWVNDHDSALIKMLGVDPGRVINLYIHDVMPATTAKSFDDPDYGMVGVSTFPFQYYVGSSRNVKGEPASHVVLDPTEKVVDRVVIRPETNMRGNILLGYGDDKAGALGFEPDHFMQGVYVCAFESGTVAHEIGHYLGLLHPFTGGCDGPISDCVDDTPPAPFGNREMVNRCDITPPKCPGQGVPNLRNLMNYSNCPDNERFFTAGQGERMRRVLQFIRRGARVESLDSFDGRQLGELQEEVMACVESKQQEARTWFADNGFTQERLMSDLKIYDVEAEDGYESEEADDRVVLRIASDE